MTSPTTSPLIITVIPPQHTDFIEQCTKQANDCNVKMIAHRLTADKYTEYAAYLKIPTLVLAVAATTMSSLFAALGIIESWAQIVAASLSALVLAFTSIGSWIGYGESAERHSAKAREFEKLLQKVKKLRDTLNGLDTDTIVRKLERTSDQYIILLSDGSYPRLPLNRESEARKRCSNNTE